MEKLVIISALTSINEKREKKINKYIYIYIIVKLKQEADKELT